MGDFKLSIDMTKEKINIFKPYLNVKLKYKGGKPADQIDTGGKPLYKLSSNENILGSSPKALAAIRQNVDKLHIYPANTDAKLRTALAEFYGQDTTPAHFMGTPSGSEALEIIIRAFLGEGLEAIVSNPAFMPYVMFSKKQGAKVIDIPLRAPDYALNVDEMLAAVNDNTRLIFLTSPNNPTGSYIPKPELDRLIYNLPEHVVVVYDEVYYQFADAEDFTTAMPYVAEGRNVIGLNSFSKAYGLAGMRIGYAYSTPEIINYISQLYKPFLLNTLAHEAAIAALGDTEFIEKTVSTVLKEKAFLYQELNKLPIKYWKTQGNFILLAPECHDLEFEEKMQKEGIMVRPVAGFGAPGCIRVTIGHRASSEAFIAGLKKCI